MIERRSTFHGAGLHCNGTEFFIIPATYGKPTTINYKHRVRDKMFNEALAEAWARRIEAGQTPLAAAFAALENK